MTACVSLESKADFACTREMPASPRLALLISGQTSRFTPSLLNLNAVALNPPFASGVDGFLALSRTNYTRQSGSRAARSGVQHHESEDELRAMLRSRVGCQYADVQILSVSELEAAMQRLDAALAASPEHALEWKASSRMRAEFVLSGSVQRWVHNGRMLYLRHLAFRMAIMAEEARATPYSHFLCLREDNHFLRPSHPLPSSFEPQRRRSARVIGVAYLDSHCSFLGAPSDKIFLVDRPAAHVLFGGNDTATSYIDFLAEWLRFGLTRLNGGGEWLYTASHRKGVDALQSEGFLASRLRSHHVAIRPIAFERTDLSLDAAGRPCVRPLYWDCGPEVLRSMNRNGPLRMCAPSTRKERDIALKYRNELQKE